MENTNEINSGEKRKIMYVDDIYYRLTMIQERFKKNYIFYTSQSVEKMFERLETVKPDLILLDVVMLEAGDFDAIAQLKTDARYSSIPIIFLTSQKDKKTIIKGRSLGAADFIVKPFTDKEFIECVEYQFDDDKKRANRPVVLSIDDNPSILQAVNSLLEDQYTVYTMPDVRSEQMLTELLKKIVPDLFLLDYNMPVLNGFDLIPIIRKFPGHEDTPILFLTSEATAGLVSSAHHFGACDYIIKPIDKKILREKIAAHTTDFFIRRRMRSLSDDRRT
jgi:PleD family two-component response regulator